MSATLSRRASQAPPPAPARVLICDDSAVVRAAIAHALDGDPAIVVAGRVADGRAALDFVRRESVDVVILDIEMPVLGGLEALPLLLRALPGLSVLVVSALTTSGAETTLAALRLGALDYIAKPVAADLRGNDAASFRRLLPEKIRALAARGRAPHRPAAARADAGPPCRADPLPARFDLLAIGCSTGGPTALPVLVRGLGRRFPVPVVVTQHMPVRFTTILAAHLDALGVLPCAEATDGETLRPGRLYLAPGDVHLAVERRGPVLAAQLRADPPENHCRPSVDVMLRTAASACEGRVLVAMLTGMGSDGLAGTRAVIEAGGAAIAQNEASSVVWGMPGAVARAGLCRAVLPLEEIGAFLQRLTAPRRVG